MPARKKTEHILRHQGFPGLALFKVEVQMSETSIQARITGLQEEYKALVAFESAEKEKKNILAHETQQLRQNLHKLSSKYDSKLLDSLSKAERKELEANAKESKALIAEWSTKFKENLPPDSARRIRLEQSVQRHARYSRITPIFPFPDPYLLPTPVLSGQILPPAMNTISFPAGPCYPDTGLMELSYTSTGEGGDWGWEAIAAPGGGAVGFVFGYVPPIEGILNVTGNVHLYGTASAYSADHWFCQAEASLSLNLYCSIFQGGYQIGYAASGIINEDFTDAKYQQLFDNVYQSPCSAYVLANAPVLITVAAFANGYGGSNYASIDLDFMSPNPQKFMLVKSIDYTIAPPS
jgi:hypothetical protein